MLVFVLNCGSSSLKFQLIDMTNEETVAKGNYERIGGDKSCLKINVSGNKTAIEKPTRDHSDALNNVLNALLSDEYHVLNSIDEIKAVGHRIVHGGEIFKESVLIDDEVISQIEKCVPLAPMHNPAGLAGIRAMKELLPNVPMVAVFDTAFHQTMPKEAYLYQIPYRYYENYHIRKYGFHGTSHRYIAKRAAEILNNNELKIVNCHLGQGASICAIKNGKSLDTSMGLTPMSGIPMATRCGDVDPSIVTFIMRNENLNVNEAENILNKESGAYGVSGVSTDYREIEEAYVDGNEMAITALDGQAYKIAQYVAQYIVSLQGIDVLTFTGGVGENGFEARERICNYLECFGIKLDKDKNKTRGQEVCISTDDSKVKIYIIPTNEELMIARDTYSLIK